MMIALLRWAKKNNKKATLFTNRKLLTEQTMRNLDSAGITYGVRAASKPGELALLRDIQISSMQTEHSRVYTKKAWELHKADLVIVDEAHMMTSGNSLKIIEDYMEMGAIPIGVTATPMGVNHIYENLVVAGKTSDLFACSALVPAVVYAPSELDTSKVGRKNTGEFIIDGKTRKMWMPVIISSVFENWQKLNPAGLPALAFAPDVKSSIYFCEQFNKRGVRAAHIDGESVWIDGSLQEDKTGELRNYIIEELKEHRIKVLWNRFVFREGIDLPWLHHLILATPIGSLKSYVQTVGRILRASPETPDKVIVQDHGGNWWRHGSPNMDRDWEQLFTMSEYVASRMREEVFRDKKEPEPITCPFCGLIRMAGSRSCPPAPLGCGKSMQKKSRVVIQLNGKLKEVTGDVLKKRPEKLKHDTQKKWDKLFNGSRRSKSPNAMSFAQAAALFYRENYYYPPKTINNMPVNAWDWHKKIRDVPKHLLTGQQERLFSE